MVLGALPYAVERGRRVGFALVLVTRWLYVGILIFSSVDPLHDGDGKREYCDILGLLWGMVWKRLAAQKMVYFLCCDCRGIYILYN